MTEQEKFEAWHRYKFYSEAVWITDQLRYMWPETQALWDGWQAAITSREPQWLPIESAPKDGSEFVAAYARMGFVKKLVNWNIIHGFWESKGEAALGFIPNATHWMPLPPPQKD